MVYLMDKLWFLPLILVLLQGHAKAVNYFHYDDCTKASNEGNIYIHKNSTWLECKNGVLERYCIAEKSNGRLDCVPHQRVKTRLDDQPSMTRYYAARTKQQYVSCSKLQQEKLDFLQEDEHKMDCLQGRQTMDTKTSENIFCTLTRNNVYYIDNYDWYKCQDGKFHLERCVKKILATDKHYCLSKQKIIDVLISSNKLSAFSKRRGTFCYEFFRRLTYYMPTYETEMQVCSEYMAEGGPVHSRSDPQESDEIIESVDNSDEFNPVTEEPLMTMAPAPAPPRPTKVPSGWERPRRTRPHPAPVTEQVPYEPMTLAPPPQTTAYVRPRRTRPSTMAPTTDFPYVPMECKIVGGYQHGKCFEVIDAAKEMMSKPIMQTFNRLDKLLTWGDMTLGKAFRILEAYRQAAANSDKTAMRIIEAIGKATGLNNCDVITKRMIINDEVVNVVAKPCTCSDDLPCY